MLLSADYAFFFLGRLGFDERIRGDYHIFTMRGVEEILNLQPKTARQNPIRLSR